MSDIAAIGSAIVIMLVMVMYQLNKIAELLKEANESISRLADEMERK